MRWTQREIVVVAAIGVVFGVVYLAWVQLWLLAQGLIGPLAMDVFFGVWCVASVIAAYCVRKPFAAFFAEMVAAAAEVATGNPAGVILLLTGVVQGAGAELPFLATRWKRYDLPVLLASGACAAVFSFVYTWIRFNYGALSPSLLIVMLVVRIVSGMVLAGLLGRYIARALQGTGALAGLGETDPKRAA
ncbi:MAG: thiamine permease [Rhizobiales bacterium 65-9]|nr:ECF transporter S component [Hyphomicrobiales bacterium]OJY37249.1 MAG: thiamine permease [Rhizobiales bacterium 65-9]